MGGGLMALGKEYELVFLLRAQMDASMKQFSLVGGQIKELEQKIQQYNNTLKDIGAYRQQTSAIANYWQKLREQEAALADVTQKFSEATAEVKAAEQVYRQHQAAIAELNLKKAEQGRLTKEQTVQMERERQALKESRAALNEAKQAEKELLDQKNQSQAAVDRLREKLGQERDKLRELSEALRKAGVDTKDLEAAEKSLTRQLQETTAEQERVTQFADRVNDLADSFTVLKMVAGGIQSALEPVMTFYKESLDAAAKLEYGMSSVQAVSGATRQETEELTAVVKEMGATTIYTAEESAKAMQNMALAGWDARQMISGLPAVIKLAAASGEDLAEMTSIVSDGMNAFQLSGEQAAVKFADVLAKAATSSNTNVSLLGQSLSYVETTAGNLGYSIEDVSLALAAMANNALKGGVAGSALNTILTRMSGSNSAASKQMEAMGLSMYYTADAMGHAEGEAKDLKTFLDELREAFRSFGPDAQAAQVAAYNLAGMRGMRGLLAIVNQSDEQWQKLTADVYDYAGAADEISSIRMDNYTGQMYLLTSAWDALQTSVGEQFLPTATDVLGVLTDITNGANDFVRDNGDIVQGIGEITATTLVLTAGISGLAVGIEGARYALTALSATKLVTLMGGFGGVLALAAAAGIAVAGFAAAAKDGVPSVDALTGAARNLNKEMDAAQANYEDTCRKTRATAEVAEAYIDKLEEIEAVTDGNVRENQEYHNVLDLLTRTVPELAGMIDLTTNAIEGGTEALRAHTEAWRKDAEEQARQEYLNSLYDKYGTVMEEAAENSIKLAEAQIRREKAEKNLLEAQERMAQLELEAAKGSGVLEREYFTLQDSLRRYEIEISKADREIETFTKAVERDNAAVAAEKDELDSAIEAIEHMSEAAEKGAQDQDELTEAMMDLFGSLEEIEEQYAAIKKKATESFEAQFGLFDKASMKSEEYLNATVKNAQEALDSQLKWWTSYRDNLSELQKLTAEDIGATKENFSALLSYVRSGEPEAAGLAASIVKSVNDGKAAAVGKLAETIGAVDKAQDEAADAVAALALELDGGLLEVEERVAKAVENMNLDEEARESARATLQALIDEAAEMCPKVQAAYERVRIAMEAGLSGSANAPESHAIIAMKHDPAYILQEVFTVGTHDAIARKYDPAYIPQFATGTNWAPRGLALVGENGPELMWMSGGERVLPTEQTRRLLDTAVGRQALEEAGAADAANVNLNMNFTVSDNATPETVRALRDYGDDIEARVERVLRRMRRDVKRRSFT